MHNLSGFSSEQRVKTPRHHIDPGFINRRKCFSAFGALFVKAFDNFAKPENDYGAKLYNDHLLVNFALEFCRSREVKTLGEIIHDPKIGQLFCSTEKLEGAEGV